jgi:thiamine-phosphate pyrophosphorylase
LKSSASQLKGIHLIIDEKYWGDKTEAQINTCIELGVKVFQFRFSRSFLFKTGNTKLQKLLSTIKKAKGLSLLNNHWHLVEQFNFDGAHIGQSDGDPYLIKNSLKDKFLGVSCYSYLGLAEQAKNAGCDYVSFGAFASSTTKPSAKILSKEQIHHIRNFEGLPMALIGGIDETNLTSQIASSFDMIAISNGILGASDVGGAIQSINRIINR